MSVHPVVEYLRTNSVKSLEARGIYARWSTVHPEKFSLNYDMIEAKDDDPLTKECRGLVLVHGAETVPGEPGAYTIVAQPFRRFFNLGQGAAAEIDWDTAAFEEKMDGTLCIVYAYGGALWSVATRSVPDADVPNSDGRTFAERFWAALCVGHKAEHAMINDERNRHLTFCFEFTAPDNQIVLPYDDTRLTLLAAFDKNGVDHAASFPDVRRPKRYTFASSTEALRWVNEQPGTALEGLVVVDGKGNRVKVKNGQYLAVAKVMTSAGSDKGLMSIVLSGTADDAKPWLPVPRQERLDVFAEGARTWAVGIEAMAASLGEFKPDPASRKTAALTIQASPYAMWIGTLLDIWMGKTKNVTSWIASKKTKEGEIPDSLVEKITVEVVRGFVSQEGA